MKSRAWAWCTATIVFSVSLPAMAGDAESLPRIDRCRVVYSFQPETLLFQAADGSMCIDVEPQVFNEFCAERLAKRPLPIPHRRLRALTDSDARIKSHEPLTGIDAKGRPWFLSADSREGLTVRWVESGRVESKFMGSGYGRHDGELVIPTRWPWVGSDMLGDEHGIWLAGRDRLFRISGDEVKEVEIAVPKGATRDETNDLFDAEQPYWAHQTYALAEQHWLVRSFFTNCRSRGSVVIRFTDDAAAVVARRHDEFVTGLVCHEGNVFMLRESRSDDGVPGEGGYTPVAIKRVKVTNPPDGLRVNGASPGADLHETLENDTLLGMTAARLVFTDRQGRQYVQEWVDEKPTDMLVIFDGKNARKVRLPSAAFVFGCQGDDGRMYGHDAQAIFTLDPENIEATFTPTASMGDLAIDDLHVLAAWHEFVCVNVRTRQEYGRNDAPVWIALHDKSADPALPGRMIAEGLPRQGNDSDYHPVAAGPDDALWFVRYEKERVPKRERGESDFKVSTQLLRARTSVVETLGEPTATSYNPTVWPLGQDTAIVATSSGWSDVEGVLFYDGGQVQRASSLKEILEIHHQRLLEVMPDGAAFVAGDTYEDTSLLRIGDVFYVQESLYNHIGNASGTQRSSGIFRDGAWLQRVEEKLGGHGPDQYRPLIQRIVAVDPRSHRLLGFTNDGKALAWIRIGPDGDEEERLEVRDRAWAWLWRDQTSLPRFSGGWILTPRAAHHALQMDPIRVDEAKARGSDMPEYDAEMRADDLRNFLRWDDAHWRKTGFSLAGGTVFRDQAGGVWNFRTREAEVSFPDGSSQIIPLDSGGPGIFRLASESKDAVWIASLESLTRFIRSPDEHGKPRWAMNRRFRLPRFGIAFSGPWIIGPDCYWASDGRLFHTPLADMIENTP